MDITLSRRMAKVMISKLMFDKSVSERHQFVEQVSKYKDFEALPEKLKAIILNAEKNAQ